MLLFTFNFQNIHLGQFSKKELFEIEIYSGVIKCDFFTRDVI